MKVLEFIQSIFVPKYMLKRKNMNIFISIGILLLLTFLLSLPMWYHLSKDRYTTLANHLSLDVFSYQDDNILDSERDKYNMLTFSDFKEFEVSIEKIGLTVFSSNIEYGKEYVLKAKVPLKDEEGTITDYKPFYMHFVFLSDDVTYDYKEKFDKLANDDDNVFRHVLIIFSEHSFMIRTGNDITNNNILSVVNYNGKAYINLNKLNNMEELAHFLIDMTIPQYRLAYERRALLYVCIFPSILAVLFGLILKNYGKLSSIKEHYNFMVTCAIPFVLFCMIFGFIKVSMANLAFNFYIFIFSIYYFVLLMILNRGKSETNEINK